ncbi:CPBP family intramembrane metalloprotease [Galbibacter sp. EGI 63066]|uniref:CPBP family intramembrane glutamic endopeptidase n=1 Tax=Galbibacter sp. EGI 63066 TaxID=2993559 RepID=UPI002248B722|nr:CPBP family intramembrane glutamic endopeptidase [Galbibacter sp. EGI 63066]MCX2680128.1 CPBP family intramembrane metalloprotease [Galbibacter sp. EGI 63066]
MFIKQAFNYKYKFPRYIIGLVLVVFFYFMGQIPLGAALFLSGKMDEIDPNDTAALLGLLEPNLGLFLMLLSPAFGLLVLLLWVKFGHQQPIRALTTARKKVDWKRIWFSFLLWASISTILVFVDIWLSPESYEFNFKLYPFLILVVIAIVMLPIQTSMEEYLFRGYLMQGLGTLLKNKWAPLVITSLMFGLLHGANPEVDKLGWGIMVYYIGTGLFLGIITLMDDGMELALGFHAANNLTAALLVTADWTALQTHSLYKDISDPVLGYDVLVPVLVFFPIIILIFSLKYGWNDWVEKLTGKIEKPLMPEKVKNLEMVDEKPETNTL